MTARAFVLLSGGIDSSTCLFLAGREYTDVTGISVFYGQRHVRELEAAKTVCRLQNAKHHILDLSAVVPKTMLTDTSQEVPNVSYEEIEGVSPTYVPFRNGLLLSAAASWIMGEHSRSSADLEPHRAGAEWALYFGRTPKMPALGPTPIARPSSSAQWPTRSIWAPCTPLPRRRTNPRRISSSFWSGIINQGPRGKNGGGG